MNAAVILAGGTGTRVGAGIPKQFIEVEGKPILAYTVDLFEKNPNIDAIEIVCHRDWTGYVSAMVEKYGLAKVRWIVDGGSTFQESVLNGIMSLKDILKRDDLVVISFGVSPLTPQDDIDDCIRVCRERGNAISSKDIDLCTCVKANDLCTREGIIRETLKGFANPWGFGYGELLDAYETAIEKDMLRDLEPHTTSLYLALGKTLWFSQCTSPSVKVTTRQDIDIFRGLLLLRRQEAATNDIKQTCYADIQGI